MIKKTFRLFVNTCVNFKTETTRYILYFLQNRRAQHTKTGISMYKQRHNTRTWITVSCCSPMFLFINLNTASWRTCYKLITIVLHRIPWNWCHLPVHDVCKGRLTVSWQSMYQLSSFVHHYYLTHCQQSKYRTCQYYASLTTLSLAVSF